MPVRGLLISEANTEDCGLVQALPDDLRSASKGGGGDDMVQCQRKDGVKSQVKGVRP